LRIGKLGGDLVEHPRQQIGDGGERDPGLDLERPRREDTKPTLRSGGRGGLRSEAVAVAASQSVVLPIPASPSSRSTRGRPSPPVRNDPMASSSPSRPTIVRMRTTLRIAGAARGAAPAPSPLGEVDPVTGT
jgi:hypothetical protein